MQSLAVMAVFTLLHSAHDSIHDSRNAAPESDLARLHRGRDGDGTCRYASGLFACPCTPEGGPARSLKPKRGAVIVITVKPTIGNWMVEFEKHYDPNAGLDLKFIVAHGEGKTKFPIESHIAGLRGALAKPLPSENRPLMSNEYQYNTLPRKDQHRYLILTTPASFQRQCLDLVHHQHKYTIKQGRQNVTRMQRIPALVASLIVVDESHRSVNAFISPWKEIKELHLNHNEIGIPSLIAMTGTPLVTGPANLHGPLLCLKDAEAERQDDYVDPHGLTVDELLAFETQWKALTKANKDGNVDKDVQMALVGNFFGKIQPLIIRRTKKMKWFKQPLLPIPACEILEVDIPFAPKYRAMYNNIRNDFNAKLDEKLAASQAAWDDKPDHEKAKTKRPVEVSQLFLGSLSRQLLVAASIPWLLEYWLQSDTAVDKFLAVDFAPKHLDNMGRMLPSCPIFKALKHREDIPKLMHLDPILQMVKSEGSKLLIFSKYLVVASMIREVRRGFSK